VDRHSLFLAAVGILLEGPPLLGRVAIATRSDLALEMAEKGQFDLVICDSRIGPVSAANLLSLLAERVPGVPLVILGEAGDERHLVDMVRLGVAGVLTKVALPHELVNTVSAVVAGHRAVAESVARQMLETETDARMPRWESLASGLSATESDILTMLGEARSIAAIATAQGTTQKRVRNHVASIYRKLGIRSRTQAVLCAARMGLTTAHTAM
jgi:DNA-binding NarL/FixJ family response regulator